MRLKQPFRDLVPRMPSEDFEALKFDIKTNGQHIPIDVDEDGNILDGHHRYDILKTKVQTKVVKGLNNERFKKLYVLAKAMNQRNLSSQQIKEIRDSQKAIAILLREDGLSQQQIADATAVPRRTISSWLDVGVGNMANPNKRVDLKITQEVKDRIVELADEGWTPPRIADELQLSRERVHTTLDRHEKSLEAAAERTSKAKDIKRKLHGEDQGVVVGDFREYWPTMDAGSVDLIFTDPPYDRESMPLYGDLAECGKHVLRDGGSLIAYASHAMLPDIINAMNIDGMRFYWMLSMVHDGPKFSRMPRSGIIVEWKPLLWFVKGGERCDTSVFVSDVIHSKHPDKDSHEWEQAVTDALHCIEPLTPGNGVVFDPMCGGGTTCVAAKHLARTWVACEIDEENALIARGRIADA